jgi:glycosyltransferase involved in cell wall biosynthesis
MMNRLSRALIIDPSLIDFSGHNVNFDWALVEALSDLGVETRIAANLRFQAPKHPIQSYATPWFTHSGYAVSEASEAELHFTFLRELKALEAAPDGQMVVFQGLPVRRLLTVLDWLSGRSWRSSFFLFFLMDAEYFDLRSGTFNDCAGSYSAFFRRLAKSFSPRNYTIMVETAKLRDDFVLLGAEPLAVRDSPHVKPSGSLRTLMSCADREPNSSRLVVAYLGHSARRHKGLHLVPSSMRVAMTRRSGLCALLCQVDTGKSSAYRDDRAAIVRELEDLGQTIEVRVVDGNVGERAYYCLLASADVLLLPYSSFYHRCGSGVFFEAFAAGKTLVIPDLGFMPETVEKYGGQASLFSEWSASSIGSAVADALSMHRSCKFLNVRAGQEWQRDHDLLRTLQPIAVRGGV